MSDDAKKPPIRFEKFADKWEQRKLSEICGAFEYGLNVAATSFDGINKYIRITDIDDSSHRFKTDDLTSPDTDLSAADNYKLTEGDILFARTGASVGKAYIYRCSDGLVYYAGFLLRAKVPPENDAEFVFQNTLTDEYDQFIRITSQRSGQPGVNAREYGEYLIGTPSKAEQEHVGSYFRNLDHLITLHQRRYDKLVNIKKAMLEKMLLRNSADVPELRFAGFSGAWEQRKLGELVQFSKGSGYSKADLKGSGTPIILYGRMYTKYETVITDVDTFATPKMGSIYSRGGEVIVPASGETAEEISVASVVEKSGILLGGDLNIITPESSIDPTFLAISISYGKPHDDMTKMAQGKSVVHLHNTDLEKIDLIYPKLEEQVIISDCFRCIDRLIALQRRKLDKLKQIKKACLEKMFV